MTLYPQCWPHSWSRARPWPDQWHDPNKPTDTLELTDEWIIPRGGEYFFSPSLKGLKERIAAWFLLSHLEFWSYELRPFVGQFSYDGYVDRPFCKLVLYASIPLGYIWQIQGGIWQWGECDIWIYFKNEGAFSLNCDQRRCRYECLHLKILTMLRH